MSPTRSASSGASWIHAPEVHAVMYGLLLIATPFILLRNYLVQAISVLSDTSVSPFGVETKVVPVGVILALIVLLIIYRKRISKLSLLAVAIVILLIALAQQVTDYYFGHNFYDLQQNWHYFAYGLFAFMVYRALKFRGLPLYRIMLITYFSAFGLSLFDEFFQMFMSSRIFDVCDIGKDVWGVYMGMILVYFSWHPQALFKDWKKIRHPRIKNYYTHPFTLLLLLFFLSFTFLNIGSILTETEYAPLVFAIAIITFLLFWAVWHISRYRNGKIVLLGSLTVVILFQSFFLFKYYDKNIIHNRYGLTVYKGIPIPFFDFMVYPNGALRLVDKKHFFNQRDRDFLLKQKTDIILIGSGVDGKGGKGFADPRHLFLYNKWSKSGTQIIIQDNLEATKTFNRLKSEHKNVLFVIHNTC